MKDDSRFEEFKKKIIDYLDKLDKEENTISKAFCLAENQIMQKSKGYDIGTIREWKGKKFKKVAPNKWVKVYDKKSRGALMAVAALRHKADQCKTSQELMQLVLQNRERFSDENGRPLPFIKDFSDYISGLNDKLENNNSEADNNNKGTESGKVDKKEPENDKKDSAKSKTDEKDYDSMSDDELKAEINREKFKHSLSGDMKADELQKKLDERKKQRLNDSANVAASKLTNDLADAFKAAGIDINKKDEEPKKEEKKSNDWEDEEDKEFAESLGINKEQFDELLADYRKANKVVPDRNLKTFMKSFVRYQLEALTSSGGRTAEMVTNINRKMADVSLICKVMKYTKGLEFVPGEAVESIENKLKGVMSAKAWEWYEDYKEKQRKIGEEWRKQQEKQNAEKLAAEKRYKGNRTPENDLLSKAVADSPIYNAKIFFDIEKELKKYGMFVPDSKIVELRNLNTEAVKKSLTGICMLRKDFPFDKDALGGGIKVGHLKDAKAWYDPNDRSIYFDNQVYQKDYKDKSNMMIPDNDAASVGIHEATHALMHYINTKVYGYTIQASIEYNRGTIVKEIVKNAVNEVKKTPYGKGLKKKQLQDAISGYAAYNEHETVSEAMADYYKYGKNANPLSIAIYKQVKAKYDAVQKMNESEVA